MALQRPAKRLTAERAAAQSRLQGAVCKEEGIDTEPAGLLVQAPKFYPADDMKKPLKRRTVARPARLRSSIKPGTVLILLAGRFKGKRVIFLKQLPSGLLLVTGPFKVNGVRRLASHCSSAA